MILDCLDGGLIKRRRQQKIFVDKWHFDRGHCPVFKPIASRLAVLSQKRYFPPTEILSGQVPRHHFGADLRQFRNKVVRLACENCWMDCSMPLSESFKLLEHVDLCEPLTL